MSDGELLKDLLRLAREEGVLEGAGLDAFAGALQERAQRIVEERLGSLEAEQAWRREAMRGLELENTWRREAMAGIEREMAWRREAMASLERENAWRREAMASLERENTWRREAMPGLERENAWRLEAMAHLEESVRALGAWAVELQTGRAETEGAHRALLDHHRKVLRLVVAELGGVAALPLLRLREARRKLAALSELLGREGS